jgi:hypothetical protein
MFVYYNNCIFNDHGFLEGLHYDFVTFGEDLIVFLGFISGKISFNINNYRLLSIKFVLYCF